MFQPDNQKVFTFTGRAFDLESGKLSLGYSLGTDYHFEETYQFPRPSRSLTDGEKQVVEKLVFFLHLAAGVSYYKAAIPESIQIESGELGPEAARFFSDLYLHGLGEFSFRNSLSLTNRCQFPQGERTFSSKGAVEPKTREPEELTPEFELSKRFLIPLGGGKDSLVTVEILRTLPYPMATFVLGDFPVIEEVAKRTETPLFVVKRRLDPLLFELNKQGAYNGHVPISAIFSLTAILTAVLQDFSTVVASQERSASSGNVVYEGREINHQYSKSFAFEEALHNLLKSDVSPALSYFSLLRPLSELHIAKIFSRLEEYHSRFTSCNRAFHLNGSQISGPGRGLWCGNCPKCRFVFLALAPFLSKKELLQIFGQNLLAQIDQLQGFLDILGLGEMKPFECVGEFEEAWWCLSELARTPEWKSDPLLQVLIQLAPELLHENENSILFSLGTEHLLDAEMKRVVHEFARP